jgi:hypothetical protein
LTKAVIIIFYYGIGRKGCGHMRVWTIVILISIIAMSGCATTRNYEKVLNALVGSHEDDLVALFGQPNKSYNYPDGTSVIEYNRSRVVDEIVEKPYLNMPGEYQGNEHIPPDNYIDTPDVYYKILWCKTRFVLDQDGIITSWNHEGNDCKASPAK